MARGLTKKQRGFVKDYLELGNGTQAALKHYDTDQPRVAQTIASENLSKPMIAKAIADAIPNDLLAERHLELLNKRDKFIVKDSEGKLFQEVDMGPEVTAVSKGLDMAYKLKGSYAPEKNVNLNIDVESTERTRELGSRIVQLFRRGN